MIRYNITNTNLPVFVNMVDFKISGKQQVNNIINPNIRIIAITASNINMLVLF